MWDLPGAGLKPVSPALAGGFLTTAPPGKSLLLDFYHEIFSAFEILIENNIMNTYVPSA